MISVITPVFNGEAHIRQCLESVIQQHCPDVEHIIVDGLSNDTTMQIVRDYAERYPHIRWISEKDKGQSDAMNKGIQAARGNILAILNVDDSYEPGTLNRVLELFKDMPEPGLLVGNCNVWNADGTLKYINRPVRLQHTDLLMGWSINPHPVNPSAYFYHRTLHDVIGLYELDNHYAMDLEFLLKATRVAHLRYINEIWGNYHLLEGTKTVTDKQSGTSAGRAQALLRVYRNRLSFWPRIWVSVNISIHHIISTMNSYVKKLRRIYGAKINRNKA